MERRKFVIGAGALATGSAAALGTGAFTSVEADRNVTVDVVEDSDAYLGFEPGSDATFADTSTEGVLELDFGSDSGNGGSGLNANADTEFGPEIKINNQGTEDVLVTVDVEDLNDEFDGNISFFLYSQEVGEEATLVQNGGPTSGGNQGVILEPGAEVQVSGIFRDVTEDDISKTIDEDITFYAVTNDSEAYPDAGPSTAGAHVPTIGE